MQSDRLGKVSVDFHPARARLSGTPNGLALDVTMVEELGAQRRVHGHFGGHELAVTQNADEPVPSRTMRLRFAPEDTFLFDPEIG